MLIYYIIFTVAFFLMAFDYLGEKWYTDFLFYLSSIFIVCFAGFRSVGIDNDSQSYLDIFIQSDSMTLSDVITMGSELGIEPGYLLVNKIFNNIDLKFRLLIFFMSVLSGSTICYWIKKKSPQKFTSLFLYLSFFYLYRDFTQIRFGASAALSIGSIFSFIDKKYYKSLFFFLFSIFFHNTSWILLLTFLLHISVKNKWFYMLFPLVGVIGVIYNPVEIIFHFFNLPDQILRYLYEDFGFGGFALSIFSQIFLVIFVLNYERILSIFKKQYVDVLIVLLATSSFINLIFIQVSIMQRFSLFLFTCFVFIVPVINVFLFNKLKKPYYGIAFHAIAGLIFLLYAYKMINVSLIRPYEFSLQ